MSIKVSEEGVGSGAESLCLCQGTQQPGSGASSHKCSHGKWLTMGALGREEEPGVSAGGDPRIGGLGVDLCNSFAQRR